MMKSLRIPLLALLIVATTGNVFAQKLKTQQLILENSIPNTVTLLPATGAFTNYSLAFPANNPNVGQVLTTTSTGPAITTSWSNVISLIAADNGLRKNGDSILLGGTLYTPTSITTDLVKGSLTVDGSGSMTVSATGGLIVNTTGGLTLSSTTTPLNTRGTPGNNNELLVSRGGASPEWSSTLTGLTLNNTTLTGTTTINGGPLDINVTVMDIDAGTTTTWNGDVTFTGTSDVTFTNLPSIPLTKNFLLVGDNTNKAAPFGPPGNDKLLISSSTGDVQWSNISDIVKARSGVEMNGGFVELGGALLDATTITTNTTGGLNLTVDGTGRLTVSAAEGLRLGTGTPIYTGATTTAGTLNQLLVSQGGGASPEWSSTLTGLTLNNTTLTGTTTINGGPLDINVTVMDIDAGTTTTWNGDVTFTGTSDVTFTNLPSIPLTKNFLLVGDNTNKAAPFGPPGNDKLLISSSTGDVQWSNISDIVKARSGVEMNGGFVELGGALLDATTITTNTTGGLNLTVDGTGRLTVSAAEGLRLGTGTPIYTGATTTAGTLNQLLVSQGGGASPEWSSTLTGLTLNNTTLTGTTTINGGPLDINVTVMDIDAGTTTTWNGDVTFTGTSDVTFTNLPSIPLTKNFLLVGDNTNKAAPFGPPGNDKLLISSSTGDVQWSNISDIVKARSGVEMNGGFVELGGALLDATTITTNTTGGLNLTVDGTGRLTVSAAEGLRLGTGTPIYTGATTTAGTLNQLLVSQGGGASPEWSSTLTGLTLNNTTLTGTTTINGGPLDINVTVMDIDAGTTTTWNGDVTFTGTSDVTFTNLPSIPLTKNFLLVGDNTNKAAPFGPPGNDKLLISSSTGDVQWSNISDIVKARSGVEMNGGFVELGGALLDATTITTNTTGGLNLTVDGTGRLTVSAAEGLRLGTGTPIYTGATTTAGTLNQLLVSQGGGASPEWSSTLTGLTLNNTTLTGTTTINGGPLDINVTVMDIDAGTTTTWNGDVTFTGTSDVTFTNLPSIPLTKNFLLVGDNTNKAAPFGPPGNDKLLISSSTGDVQWSNISDIVKARSGVEMNGGFVELGGALLDATTITTNTTGGLNLTVDGTGRLTVSAAEGLRLGTGTPIYTGATTTAGTLNQLLVSQGGGASPEWSSTLTGLTLNNTTLTGTTTINGGPLDINVTVMDIDAGTTTTWNGDVTFTGTSDVTFTNLPSIPLTKNFLLVGDNTNKAAPFGPPGNDKLLISSSTGDVQWSNISDIVKARSGVEMNGGFVELGGALLDATTITTNTTGGLNLTVDGTGRLTVSAAEGLRLGTGTPIYTGATTTAGTLNQLLVSQGGGASPEWSSTLTGLTLNNTTLTGTTTINGGPLDINVTVMDIDAGTTTTWNGDVTFTGTSDVTFTNLPSIPLTKNFLLVGDNTNKAAPFGPPGNDKLLISSSTGDVQWSNISDIVKARSGVEMNGGFVELGGALLDATTITTNTTGGLNLTVDGTGRLTVSAAEGLRLGTGTPIYTGATTTAGTLNQLLVSQGGGASPEWSSTLTGLTLNNTTLTGTTTINGGPLDINVTVMDIDAGTTTTWNGDVTFTGTSDVTFTNLPSIPLTKNFLLVGDNTNKAAPFGPPGNDKLLISSSTGDVQWSNISDIVKARSGVEMNGGFVELGGALLDNTDIALAGKDLSLTGIGNVAITQFTSAGIIKNNAAGVLSSGKVNLADNTNEVTGTLGVTNGGTGTNGTPGNGTILIGNGSAYTLGTITPGTGINVTNGVGTITISSSILDPGTTNNSTLRWNDATSRWTENLNILSTAAGNLSVAAGVTLTGTTSALSTRGTDGNNNQILKSRGTGNSPEWVDISSLVLASNGLSKDADTVQLGGTLNEPTTITTQAANGLTIAGNGAFNVNTIGNGATAGGFVLGDNTELNTAGSNGVANDILVSRGDGNSPQWKSINSFFVSGRVSAGSAVTLNVPVAGKLANQKVIVTLESASTTDPVISYMVSSNGAGSFDVTFTAIPTPGSFISYIVLP